MKSADVTDWLPGEFAEEATAAQELQSMIWDLSTKPVPTGRLMRSVPALTAPIKAALLLGANWASAAFHGGTVREEKLKQGRIKAALSLLAAMAHLRGLFTKVGQLLANYPTLVPAEVADTLWSLNFQSPPMHFSLVREMFLNELGTDPEKVFASFETRAFAAASLGQVHRARLRSGEDVAVKIQYPNIGATIRQDLANLKALLSPLRLSTDWDNLKERLDDLTETLSMETDYENEARQLNRARELFAGDSDFAVPRTYSEISSRRVLVMDYLPGVHLDRFLSAEPTQGERDRYGTLILRSSMRLFYRARLVYSDISPGNYIFMPDGRLGLIDFGCSRLFSDDEWEYCRGAHRATQLGGEALQAAIKRSATGSETVKVTDAYMQAAEDLNEWSQRPIRTLGPFDFGSDAYFKEGVQLLARLQMTGYYRNEPISLWLIRCFLSVRALLNRLGARVDMHREMEVESPPDIWV
jgi:predicted unusual protein kinase regulating ubiquinone biosynthesis (AarF/ABC1/UbiB family)